MSRGNWGNKATKSPTLCEIAWAAGLYEGEGHCGITGNTLSTKGSPFLKVSQKDPWILERLQPLFGGSIQKPRKGQVCYQWAVFGPRARGVAQTLFTFLSPRRREQLKSKVLCA